MTAAKKGFKNTQIIEDALTAGREAFEAAAKAGEETLNGYDEMAAVGKENLEAVIQSSTILANGARDVNKMWIDMARTAMEDGANAYRTLTECKDISKAVEAQSALAKSACDKFVTDTQKVSDAAVALTDSAMAPISKRYDAEMEKFTKSK